MLTIFGSIALDTIRTPNKTLYNILGGAAAFSGISASFFSRPGIIAVIGNDFPKKYYTILNKYVNTDGLIINNGKSFRYYGMYNKTLTKRKTLKVELNVLDGFKPKVPDKYKESNFIYLANNDPDQGITILKEFNNIKFCMCDTIEFWITTKKSSVIKMIKNVDVVTINDEEARLLTKESNLVKCAKKIIELGTKCVIIKKGEHGSILFYEDIVFPVAAFPLENIKDPTGAGDSFGGAMMGYLNYKRTINVKNIKKSIIYGNILGSFTVENYGIDGLLNLKKIQIMSRIKEYEKMIKL